MNRKLIIGERLMYVNADTSVNGAFVAKIRGLISLDRLRNALNKVQKKHPLLQAKIVEDKPVYRHLRRMVRCRKYPFVLLNA